MPSQLRLTKKRKSARLRLAIQAFNKSIVTDDNTPGDLDECHTLSYEEYAEMVRVIANAKKHAVE